MRRSSLETLTHMNTSAALPTRPSRGFTLMELLVVVAIIMILAALSLGGLRFMQGKQAEKKCRAQIAMLSSALEEYKLDFGRYPVANDTGTAGDMGSNVLFVALYWDSDGNGAGVGADPNQRIYLPELDPGSTKQGWSSNPIAGPTNTILDPWQQPYRYRSGLLGTGAVNNDCINPDFDLWSFGPDGVAGSATGNDPRAQDNITNWK